MQTLEGDEFYEDHEGHGLCEDGKAINFRKVTSF